MYVAIDGSQLGRIAVGTREIDVGQVRYRRLKIMEYSGGWPSSGNDVQSSLSRPDKRPKNIKPLWRADHPDPADTPGRTRRRPYRRGPGFSFPDHRDFVFHKSNR